MLHNFTNKYSRSFFFLAVAMTLCLMAHAQDNYCYYYGGKKIGLTLEKNFLNIIPREGFEKTSITHLGIRDFALGTDGQKITKIEFQSEPTDVDFFKTVHFLKQNLGIAHVSLYFKKGEHSSIGTSNVFYVKLKANDDFEKLRQVAGERNIKIERQVPNMPLWYILSMLPDAEGYSFEAANFFYETGFIDEVDPAFMFDFKPTCTNDPMFGSLWGLNNTSNPNIDINACQAWDISQGAGVTVAIVDTGIDKAHSDLAANISTTSFNSQTGTSPSGSPDNHGTHVAGIVGARRNNSLQVTGVAPQSKLMSISHPLSGGPTMAAELASGISFAWQNNAHIINNSWGDQGGEGYSEFHSAILENSIVAAMTQGRDGKGAIVVFAAGNFGSTMDYPANFHDDILTVGSITSSGARSGFSGYGTKLDVVAPGSDILSTFPDNSTSLENGTSMAAPHVSGIAALILYLNPNLTRCDVASIIEGTSQKIGGYSYTTTTGRSNGTWNNEMGYGLVDAFGALQAALPALSNASPLVCTEGTQFTLNNAPMGAAITWSASPANLFSQSSGSFTSTGGSQNITLNATSGTSSGTGTLTVTNTTCGASLQAQKTFWVGPRQPTGFVSVVIDPWLKRILAMVVSVPDATGYEWYINGSLFTGANMNSNYVQMPISGSCSIPGYTVGVKAINGCGTSTMYSGYYVNPCYEEGFLYSYYPNPATETLTIEKNYQYNTENSNENYYLNNKIQSAYCYRLYDLNTGLIVLEGDLSAKTEIDVSRLRKGKYVLKIQIEKDKEETHSVIID